MNWIEILFDVLKYLGELIFLIFWFIWWKISVEGSNYKDTNSNSTYLFDRINKSKTKPYEDTSSNFPVSKLSAICYMLIGIGIIAMIGHGSEESYKTIIEHSIILFIVGLFSILIHKKKY